MPITHARPDAATSGSRDVIELRGFAGMAAAFAHAAPRTAWRAVNEQPR